MKTETIRDVWEIYALIAENGRLQAENAKLRRLVRVYRACHDHIDACRGCSERPDCEALEDMQTIGSEVGIEAYDA